jgi:hypothetical protein
MCQQTLANALWWDYDGYENTLGVKMLHAKSSQSLIKLKLRIDEMQIDL